MNKCDRNFCARLLPSLLSDLARTRPPVHTNVVVSSSRRPVAPTFRGNGFSPAGNFVRRLLGKPIPSLPARRLPAGGVIVAHDWVVGTSEQIVQNENAVPKDHPDYRAYHEACGVPRGAVSALQECDYKMQWFQFLPYTLALTARSELGGNKNAEGGWAVFQRSFDRMAGGLHTQYDLFSATTMLPLWKRAIVKGIED